MTNKQEIKEDSKDEVELATTLEACDKLYIQCIEIRNFEISNLVSRNNFFMIFQGVLIAGAIQASSSAPPIVQFLACCIGLFISLFQTMTACGAKFWQEAWEEHLKKSEQRLANFVKKNEKKEFHLLFSEDAKKTKIEVKNRLQSENPKSMTNFLVKKFSVSKSPIYAGIAFTFFWGTLLFFTIETPYRQSILCLIKGFPK